MKDNNQKIIKNEIYTQNDINYNDYFREIYSILTEIEVISSDINYRLFLKNELLYNTLNSMLYHLQLIIKNIDIITLEKYPYVEWSYLLNIYDNINHVNYSLSYDLLWDFIKLKLKFIKRALLPIVECCSHYNCSCFI